MDAQHAPTTRLELAERLADLRQQGVIDAMEEDRLLRHFDDMQRNVDEEKARLEPEYLRRCKEDGEESAYAWLSPIVTEIGRRNGEETRRITDQLRVVTG